MATPTFTRTSTSTTTPERGGYVVMHDGYIYNSAGLHADLENGHLHPRAHPAEIAVSLGEEGIEAYFGPYRPSPETLEEKEWEWHWYTSQLFYYGLDVTVDIVVAKKQLLDALKEHQLVLPSYMLARETAMRRQWEMVRFVGEWMGMAEPEPEPQVRLRG